MQIITNQFQKELKKHGSDAFPILVSYEQLSRYESGSFMWHWHPEIEITLVQSGQMIYKVNRQTYHLKEGDVLFGNANVLHSGVMENLEDCRYISVTFLPKLIYGFYESIVCQKYVEPVTQDFSLSAVCMDGSCNWHKEFADEVKEIIRLYEEQTGFFELDIIIALQKMWKILLKNDSAGTSAGPEYTSHDKKEYERIKQVMAFLEQNYGEKLSLKDIAAHINLCESESSRLFKKYMNVSLFTFLQEYRIERSLEYLAQQELSITEVAANVGFADSNYYSKVFSKIKGCNPREYRKRKG